MLLDTNMTKNLKSKRKINDYEANFKFPSRQTLKFAVLNLDNVTFGYSKEECLFRNVNLTIDLTSRVAIVGSNGLGKSTLLKLLSGDLTPTEGEVNKNRRLRVATYSQHNCEQLDYEQSGIEFLVCKHNIDRQSAHKVLGSFGLPSRVHRRKLGQLSGGEKAKVRFADIACLQPDILILDEPTVHLDIFTTDGLIEAINQFKGGVVLVSHDQTLIKNTNCKLYVLEDKKLCEFYGNFNDYRAKVLSEIKMQQSTIT